MNNIKDVDISDRCPATATNGRMLDQICRCVYKRGHEGDHYNDESDWTIGWEDGGKAEYLDPEGSPSTELSKWADQAMFEAIPMASKRPSVTLLSCQQDPLGVIAASARMYEGKPTYDLADITDKERVHYWNEIQQTHLQTPLENVTMHFFIEAVDRSFTHQMVRQRTARYAQESLRFAVKEGFASEVILPPSLIVADKDTKEVWDETLKKIEETYQYLIGKGIPAEDARALLPHCVATRINYVTDLKSLTDHSGNRLCTQAQFIWREVFLGIVQAIDGYHGFVADPMSIRTERTRWEHLQEPGEGPLLGESVMAIPVERMQDDAMGSYTNWQFKMIAQSKLFRPICFRLGRCPFMADFDRQCTIRGRVNEGRFDEIDPAEYMADPTAGRRD